MVLEVHLGENRQLKVPEHVLNLRGQVPKANIYVTLLFLYLLLELRDVCPLLTKDLLQTFGHELLETVLSSRYFVLGGLGIRWGQVGRYRVARTLVGLGFARVVL